MNRTNVKTVEVTSSLELVERMKGLSEKQVSVMLKRIAELVEKRGNIDPEAFASKDFKELRKWTTSQAVARYFIAEHIDPRAYILNETLSDGELKKRGFDPNARTVNLKAYKKVRELCEYALTGLKLEAVAMTFIACALLASRHFLRIERNVAERFLSNVDLSSVSPDMADAVRDFQAKHMTTGAGTQTSQLILTLANMRAGRVLVDGRSKDFALDAKSPLIRTLAARFGMLDVLDAIPERTEAQPEEIETVTETSQDQPEAETEETDTVTETSQVEETETVTETSQDDGLIDLVE